MTSRRGLAVVAIWLSSAAGLWAQDMPDASQIHGRAIPAAELADGTVTVRVVNEAIGNNLSGEQVRLSAGGAVRTATTDELGRAEFSRVPAGAEVVAEATVDGEPLVSQPFRVPSSGGLRVVLVAGLARAAERRRQQAAEEAALPPTKGLVVFGNESRVLTQFQNDSLEIYYLLDVTNNARARVDIGGPLVIDLPRGATSTTVLQGSSPSVSASGDRVTVAGPFASGSTSVQIAFRMPYSSSTLTLSQTWPAAMPQVIVGVQRVGSMALSSPQFSQTEEVTAEGGDVYMLGRGPALPAGGTLTFSIAGLPVHSRTPRHVALVLAALAVGLGVWLSVTGVRDRQTVRQTLMARRDRLLGQLAQLEFKRRASGADADAQARRRARLMTELEQIYGELDETHTGPQGGGEGVTA